MWDSWLPKMRAVLKEALAKHPILTGPPPADECAQYALLECVWLFDRRGQPWLIGMHAAPNFFPISNVDRHSKNELMKDLYSLLVAPVVEEATPELGSFVPL